MEGRRLLLTIPFRWLLSSRVLLYNLLFTASSIRAVMYESIQWSPQNPKFRFTTEEFRSNQSYYKLSVLTTSSIYFVCPNPTTIFNVTKMSIPKEELNENLWIVDKKSFETCNIDRNNTENKLLKQCIWNSEYNRRPYRKIVFQRYSGTMSGLQFIPGHEYYFIATSNGLENSLNNTSGGHCKNKDKGVSMRVIFYICKDMSDCEEKNTTITTTVIPVNVTAHEPNYTNCQLREPQRREPSIDFMKYLTIAFGVVAGVSILLNAILCVCLVGKRSRSNKRDSKNECGLTNYQEENQSNKPVANNGFQSQTSHEPLLSVDKRDEKKKIPRPPVKHNIHSNNQQGVGASNSKKPVPKPRKEAPRIPVSARA